jgi:hypothetical protein
MIKPYQVSDPARFIQSAAAVTSTKAMREMLLSLPIVGENEYVYDESDPERGWRPGHLHWYPVGKERGNAGRIQHAGSPENPIAERTINAMEAVIEMARQRELKVDPGTPPPQNPREAVLRYFELPPLDALPQWEKPIRGKKAYDYARELSRLIRVRLVRELRPVELAVMIDDDGIGQPPQRMHSTLLSLGRSDKPDKPYLIGVFGQGGSSAYAASDSSWLMSRRVSDLLDGAEDGVGWTAVKRIIPTGRRDVYWAYLAAHPDGRVLALPPASGNAIGFAHGTRIAHLKYDFGPRTEPQRNLYQALNHLLFKPVLPYEIYTKGKDKKTGKETPDPRWGNGYRLSLLKDDEERLALDKLFAPQTVEKKSELDA